MVVGSRLTGVGWRVKSVGASCTPPWRCRPVEVLRVKSLQCGVKGFGFMLTGSGFRISTCRNVDLSRCYASRLSGIAWRVSALWSRV